MTKKAKTTKKVTKKAPSKKKDPMELILDGLQELEEKLTDHNGSTGIYTGHIRRLHLVRMDISQLSEHLKRKTEQLTKK